MVNKKQLAYGVLVIGLFLVALSVLIDPLRGHHIYMATIQYVALLAGLMLALAGAYLAFMRQTD